MITRRSYHIFATLAALLGFYGVAAGAVAAHVIADPHAAARVSTAALYALIHAAVLIGWRGDGRWDTLIKTLLVAGVLLFSGSLTLTYAAGFDGAAKLAPAGGTLLLAGWLCLAVSSARSIIVASKGP